MYNEGIKRRWLPGLQVNPCQHVEVDAQGKQVTALKESELRSFLRALPELPEREEFKQIFRLQLLTCSRVSEVSELPWAELDLEAGVWTLPTERSKNGQEHRVMLSKQALAVLRGQGRVHGAQRVRFPQCAGYATACAQ